MSVKVIIVLAALTANSLAQRSPYAGRRPIGYPMIEAPTAAPTAALAAGDNDLGNRFSNDESTPRTTTQRLPIEALGDRDLVNRISRLPQENQPFWYINWQALEQQRRNPQTYPQKVNNFIGNRGSME